VSSPAEDNLQGRQSRQACQAGQKWELLSIDAPAAHVFDGAGTAC